MKIDMRKFIEDIATTAHPELLAPSRDQALTPAADDLFKLSPESNHLDPARAESLHICQLRNYFS